MKTISKRAASLFTALLSLSVVTVLWMALLRLPMPDPQVEETAEEETIVIEAEQIAASASPIAPTRKAASLFTVSVPDMGEGDSLLYLQGEDQILLGGQRPILYYNQKDPRWSLSKYGTDNIGTHACGPTVMAMVVSTLTDRMVTPVDMSQWAVEDHHWVRDQGSALTLIQAAAEAHGLEARSFPQDPEAICEALRRGDLLVALMGPGTFTSSGHFILLRGISAEGDIQVADPNSYGNSLKGWELSLLLDELSWNTNAGGPLWLIPTA